MNVYLFLYMIIRVHIWYICVVYGMYVNVYIFLHMTAIVHTWHYMTCVCVYIRMTPG